MTAATEHTRSIQERLYPDHPCYGCGHANERGLKLRSYESETVVGSGLVVGTFHPWPEHDNGVGYLNGGIISTVLDCHGAAAVILEADRNGWEPPPGALLPYVTAGLDVSFRRPTPLDEDLSLEAELLESSEAEMTVLSRIVFEDKVRAEARAVWKRWRAR
jgi:acyl-coenzyme A thioesterase PaaI-like protein